MKKLSELIDEWFGTLDRRARRRLASCRKRKSDIEEQPNRREERQHKADKRQKRKKHEDKEDVQ